jgi:hypothetical protein
MGKPQVEGHWHSLIEGFSTSSLDFYELVKVGIARREIPDLKISQIEWKEGGLGAGKRVYLRISREGLNFDICAVRYRVLLLLVARKDLKGYPRFPLHSPLPLRWVPPLPRYVGW